MDGEVAPAAAAGYAAPAAIALHHGAADPRRRILLRAGRLRDVDPTEVDRIAASGIDRLWRQLDGLTTGLLPASLAVLAHGQRDLVRRSRSIILLRLVSSALRQERTHRRLEDITVLDAMAQLRRKRGPALPVQRELLRLELEVHAVLDEPRIGLIRRSISRLAPRNHRLDLAHGLARRGLHPVNLGVLLDHPHQLAHCGERQPAVHHRRPQLRHRVQGLRDLHPVVRRPGRIPQLSLEILIEGRAPAMNVRTRAPGDDQPGCLLHVETRPLPGASPELPVRFLPSAATTHMDRTNNLVTTNPIAPIQHRRDIT